MVVREVLMLGSKGELIEEVCLCVIRGGFLAGIDGTPTDMSFLWLGTPNEPVNLEA